MTRVSGRRVGGVQATGKCSNLFLLSQSRLASIFFLIMVRRISWLSLLLFSKTIAHPEIRSKNPQGMWKFNWSPQFVAFAASNCKFSNLCASKCYSLNPMNFMGLSRQMKSTTFAVRVLCENSQSSFNTISSDKLRHDYTFFTGSFGQILFE